MARDFDFKPRRQKPVSAPRRSRDFKGSFVVTAAVVLSLLGGAYWAFVAGSTVGQPTDDGNVQNTTKSNLTTNDTVPLTTTKPSEVALTIQLYDSGAGPDEVDRVKARLETLGYVVKNLGRSQFDYEVTYIWHRANREQEAKELAAILEGREIVLRQSQISGIFEVLIFLGKK